MHDSIWQELATFAMLGIAAIYVARRFVGSSTGASPGGCGSCGSNGSCASSSKTQNVSNPPLHVITIGGSLPEQGCGASKRLASSELNR